MGTYRGSRLLEQWMTDDTVRAPIVDTRLLAIGAMDTFRLPIVRPKSDDIMFGTDYHAQSLNFGLLMVFSIIVTVIAIGATWFLFS